MLADQIGLSTDRQQARLWSLDPVTGLWKDEGGMSVSDPKKLGANAFSRSVFLNHCFESRISILCAALSSLCIKPLMFCITDFVLLKQQHL